MRIVAAKFGGSSLADARQFQKVAQIIREDSARRYIVASAPGKRISTDIKVTDLLYKCYELAESRQDFEIILQQIKERFASIIDDLGLEFDLRKEIDMIRQHLMSEPSRDYMASRGEYLNSKILAAFLGFAFVDPAECIFFQENGELNTLKTDETLGHLLSNLPNAVIAGFYGSLPNGHIHTFSRGGSDITGSLVAAAVKADLCENWTDVSGLLAADPRVVDDPRVVNFISYRELRILSYMGASVLHTDAVLPARKAGIPIHIRNTNRPADPGTMIVADFSGQKVPHTVTGIAGRTGLSVVQIEKTLVSDGAGFTAVLLDIFKARGIPFEQCLTGIDTVSVVIRSDLFLPEKDNILKEINDILEPDVLLVEDSLSMIAVVGERASDARGITVHILEAVADAGIEVNTINQGSGNLNLIIGVQDKDYENTIRAIYRVIK